jgi:hypothetical protein
MNKLPLAKIFKGAGKYVAKRSPEILLGLGITGMLTTTVLAVKATPKAVKMIEEKKKLENKEKLTVKETIQTTWKCYVPAAITGVSSTACLIGAGSVHARRNAALATAYKLSETAFNEYREKMIEEVGEKKDQAVYEKIAQDRVNKTPLDVGEIINTGKGTARFMDGISGRRFLSDRESIRKAVNEINYRLTTDFCGYVTDDLRMFSSYYVYYDACQNYIGTICNLDEPITKTDSQSLKITYSITDA